MIQSKWWEVGRIIPYDFVMYDLYFCHFKTYEILHSVLRHPVVYGFWVKITQKFGRMNGGPAWARI